MLKTNIPLKSVFYGGCSPTPLALHKQVSWVEEKLSQKSFV